MTAVKARRGTGEGAILGALVGDAAEATLEFIGRAPTPGEAEDAMWMTGDGPWRGPARPGGSNRPKLPVGPCPHYEFPPILKFFFIIGGFSQCHGPSHDRSGSD